MIDETGLHESDELCSTCEVADLDSNGSLVPVWENPADYNRAKAPDYIGCTECETMEPFTEDGE